MALGGCEKVTVLRLRVEGLPGPGETGEDREPLPPKPDALLAFLGRVLVNSAREAELIHSVISSSMPLPDEAVELPLLTR